MDILAIAAEYSGSVCTAPVYRSMICASHPILAEHRSPQGHPEHPHRLTYIREDIERTFGSGFITTIERQATKAELCLAHDEEYIDMLLSKQHMPHQLDEETFLSEGSIPAIRSAAGICLELVESIVTGTPGADTKAFAFIRPPGHHAGRSRGMGYCIVNNMAVAVKRAQQLGVRKTLILDWDVHHGNGTQEIFYDTDSVLFIDLHQENLFPKNSGLPSDIGAGAGAGFTLNIPLPPRTRGSQPTGFQTSNSQAVGLGYLEILQTVVYPAVQAYQPDLICVSSGFDALDGDLEGNMALQPADFAAMTALVCDWADEFCGGKLLMTL
ncbi:MAG: histone deacetylase, partial [Spirochaetaceae bacterium]|nr:histone deacetylase [Spirochaetaceae bacterium]